MLGGVGSIGTLSARRRVIAAAGGGGSNPVGDSRSGSGDHVHTLSSLNTLFMIPDIHYIFQSVNDNTENYSVKDILFTSGSNASHTFYVAVKGKNNTLSFHNDLAIGAIQIHTASSVVFAGGAEDASGFTSIPDHTNSADPTADPMPGPGGVGTLTFGALGTASSGTPRWNVRSSTNSSNTGAADSIATTFQNTSNALPNAGEDIIPQVNATNYLGCEGSGFTINEFVYLKFTVSLATNTAHRFIFAYNFGIQSTDSGNDKDDNVGLYIEN